MARFVPTKYGWVLVAPSYLPAEYFNEWVEFYKNVGGKAVGIRVRARPDKSVMTIVREDTKDFISRISVVPSESGLLVIADFADKGAIDTSKFREVLNDLVEHYTNGSCTVESVYPSIQFRCVVGDTDSSKWRELEREVQRLYEDFVQPVVEKFKPVIEGEFVERFVEVANEVSEELKNKQMTTFKV